MILSVFLVLCVFSLFVSSAAHKLFGFSTFARQVADYQLVPPVLATPGAVIVLALELTCILLLVIMPVYGVATAAGLLLLYATAMGSNLVRGRTHIDCGCFARPQATGFISWAMVARNTMMAVICGVASIAAPIDWAVAAGFGWFDWVGLASALVAGIFLYQSGDQLLALEHKA
ncbi:MAG: MauE/DoxX family redox-associated membrane protein [Sphingomonadales bacterium]